MKGEKKKLYPNNRNYKTYIKRKKEKLISMEVG